MDNADAQARLQPFLQPGERILWTGWPDPRRLLSAKDAFLIPFSLFWGGFALVWEGSVLFFMVAGPSGPPIFFALWGIPFVVVGQYLIWGRFIGKRWDRRRTAYALTNQRILVLRGRWLKSMFVNSLPALDQTTRSDGSGSLEFGHHAGPWGYGMWANTGMDFFTMGMSGVAFYDIEDVAGVARLINQARFNPT